MASTHLDAVTVAWIVMIRYKCDLCRNGERGSDGPDGGTSLVEPKRMNLGCKGDRVASPSLYIKKKLNLHFKYGQAVSKEVQRLQNDLQEQLRPACAGVPSRLYEVDLPQPCWR